MDENTAQNQESLEIKNLEEELKTLGKTQENPELSTQPSGTSPSPIAQTIPQPPPQAEAPQTPPVMPNVPQPKGSKMLVAAVGFLVLSLILAGAYVLGTGKVGPKACTEEARLCPDGSSVGRVGPNCEFAQCPTSTPDPTANWSGYTSSTGTFSFKYPSDVNLTIQEEGPSAEAEVILLKQGPTQKPQTELFDALRLSFAVWNTSNYPTLEEFIDYLIQGSKTSGTAEIKEDKMAIVLNGYSGFSYTVEGLGTHKYIFLQSPDKKTTVNITDSTVDPTNQGFRTEVDQILSTFKFIDTSGYVCPTGEDPNCDDYLPNASVRLECTPEYQAWALKNCPTYKTGSVSTSPSPTHKP